jgi:hypothetical protein
MVGGLKEAFEKGRKIEAGNWEDWYNY